MVLFRPFQHSGNSDCFCTDHFNIAGIVNGSVRTIFILLKRMSSTMLLHPADELYCTHVALVRGGVVPLITYWLSVVLHSAGEDVVRGQTPSQSPCRRDVTQAGFDRGGPQLAS